LCFDGLQFSAVVLFEHGFESKPRRPPRQTAVQRVCTPKQRIFSRSPTAPTHSAPKNPRQPLPRPALPRTPPPRLRLPLDPPRHEPRIPQVLDRSDLGLVPRLPAVERQQRRHARDGVPRPQAPRRRRVELDGGEADAAAVQPRVLVLDEPADQGRDLGAAAAPGRGPEGHERGGAGRVEGEEPVEVGGGAHAARGGGRSDVGGRRLARTAYGSKTRFLARSALAALKDRALAGGRRMDDLADVGMRRPRGRFRAIGARSEAVVLGDG
jgi:hypothetical protein